MMGDPQAYFPGIYADPVEIEILLWRICDTLDSIRYAVMGLLVLRAYQENKKVALKTANAL